MGQGAHVNMGSESLLDLDGKSFSMDSVVQDDRY